MTPLQKKKLKSRIAEFLTVGRLIEHLQQFPKDLVVGRSGHFGEFLSMDERDIYTSKAYTTVSGSWRDGRQLEFPILQIVTPYLGPEPD